jgi:hypothetical protein
LLNAPDAPPYLLIAYREEQDRDQQAIKKDQQEHEPSLTVHAQLFLQARKPALELRAGGLYHGVLIVMRYAGACKEARIASRVSCTGVMHPRSSRDIASGLSTWQSVQLCFRLQLFKDLPCFGEMLLGSLVILGVLIAFKVQLPKHSVDAASVILVA